MIYELRVYHAVPGRLPDLLKRFDTITLKIWQRHGIEQAGFWTVLVCDSNAGSVPIVEAAAAHGLHALVEKPMAHTDRKRSCRERV